MTLETILALVLACGGTVAYVHLRFAYRRDLERLEDTVSRHNIETTRRLDGILFHVKGGRLGE